MYIKWWLQEARYRLWDKRYGDEWREWEKGLVIGGDADDWVDGEYDMEYDDWIYEDTETRTDLVYDYMYDEAVDVEEDGVNSSDGFWAYAIQHYAGETEVELTFEDESWIWVLQCNEDGWWHGVVVHNFDDELDIDQAGWFSSDFVRCYQETEFDSINHEEIGSYEDNDEYYYNEFADEIKQDEMGHDASAHHGLENLEWWHDSKHVFDSIRNEDIDWIRWLFSAECGHSVECIDECGNTPLLCAAACGSKKIVKMLLRRGANLNAQNYEGQSVLDICFLNGHKRLLKYMHKKISKAAQGEN